VVSLEVVLPDLTVAQFGAHELDVPANDMSGLLTGSEGTMALVTKIGRPANAQTGSDPHHAGHLHSVREAGQTVAA